MSSNVFTNTSLNVEIDEFVQRVSYSQFSHFKDVFLLLRQTGLRANELQYFDTWDFNENGSISAITSKHGNIREIDVSMLTESVLKSVIDSKVYFYLPKYETIQKTFNKISKHRYSVKNKNVNTHIFRHNFIKQQRDEGVGSLVVAEILGLKKSSTVDIYYNSVIHYHDKLKGVVLSVV